MMKSSAVNINVRVRHPGSWNKRKIQQAAMKHVVGLKSMTDLYEYVKVTVTPTQPRASDLEVDDDQDDDGREPGT